MAEEKKPHIKIYSTPSCVYCKMAKQFFAENNVEYQDVNVALDAHELEQMVNKSGQRGVPVIEVNEEIIVGFDQPRLKELLGIA